MEEFDMKQDREELTPEPLRILKRDAKVVVANLLIDVLC